MVPALILGPGTGLIIAIGAVPIALLLDFSWPVAFIGGAVLASTDPVVLREVLRDEGIPRSIRDVLKIEAGMNDLVTLPVILGADRRGPRRRGDRNARTGRHSSPSCCSWAQ